jgi:hypothetical protein
MHCTGVEVCKLDAISVAVEERSRIESKDVVSAMLIRRRAA